MAKTIAELSALCDALSSRLETTRQEVTDLWAANEKLLEQLQTVREDAARSREEAAHTRRQLDEAREAGRLHVREIAELRQENAVLRQQFRDHLNRVETWSGRLWTLITVLVGAILSLASGLIIALSKK